MSNVDEFLEHYGVKGMRWGVRGGASKSGGGSPRFKNASKPDRAVTRFKKAPSKLSDSELQKRIQRLEAERKYNALNRRTVGNGEKLVSEVLTSSGRRIATTVVTNAGTLAVGALIASRMGEGTGAAVVRRLK